MHLGTGEEAIVAGIMDHLQEGDALALDHRGTPPLIMRGVDPVLILRELLGQTEGLCGGNGGHMHLFSKAHLAASSGIVGAAGPAGVGFGLAAHSLRPGTIAVAFFGEGAMNQGMLMEAMNLAVVWNLPVLFVCKDDAWSITAESDHFSGGTIRGRAQSLGLQVQQGDGRDVVQVWKLTQKAVQQLRNGGGPQFLHLGCVHLKGHFLGYQLIRITHNPLKELPSLAVPLIKSFFRPRGAPLQERLASLKIVLSAILKTWHDPREDLINDPIFRTRNQLTADLGRLEALEDTLQAEIRRVVAAASQEA
jgi:pyruvate dehydrogenase E1 component alpha subunit